MGKFKDLRVWADAMDLTAEIYRITQLAPFNKDYAFLNQIRRAAVSIPSNIAEGDERGTNREAVHFFNIAKGSAAELITQLNIACRIGYLETGEMETLENLAEKIRASLKI
ncbi:MAG: four helix bundle protein [Saprospirales bacterium]|jgi:four helix bundle protein|nr:four helix bundle protein [Saprospirales bacterium]MBK8920224.1 four helix bundle protein [Saprospirales bacterium]